MLRPLDDSWRMQSSARVPSAGERISTPGFDDAGWYPAALPATVLGTLVDNGVYADPFAGTNFLRIPGQGPPHENFSLYPMPEDSPFRASWWFRREFGLDAGPAWTWLQLLGINYRADVWLNGRLVAARDAIAGAYRGWDLGVSEHVRPGVNVLAIEVFPPAPDDLAITWVDWNPSPPDKNMGLWRGVRLQRCGPVALRDPQVVMDLAAEGRAAAGTVHVTVLNATAVRQQGRIRGRLADVALEAPFDVPAGGRAEVAIGGAGEPLILPGARLWWPRGMGEQPMYRLSLTALAGDVVSDETSLSFGMRRVTSELTDRGHALFRVNGRPVLIRGGGWARDLFLRENAERDLHEYEYVKHLGLNAIRFEGMLERGAFLERCDRDGILVIAGWCCCDHWERWDAWTPEDHEIAAESLRAEVRRVRHHPSVIAWWYGSDNPPPAPVEARYLDVLREERWPNPSHSSASQKPAELTGPSGMKMLGPYDYVPPAYWYTDAERGGAFGFATEIGPGPAIPPIESLRSMLTEAHLWPPDEAWTLHCGGGVFRDLTRFDEALAARYGPPAGVEEYALKAQLSAYESQRAMFEAYTRNRYGSTGVIQWMLNNAWPSLIWHLWDWYLRPGGGYFGTKKACEPLHAQFSYDDRSVVVINLTGADAADLEVDARLLTVEGRTLFARTEHWSAAPDSTGRLFRVPEPGGPAGVHFLRLALRRGGEPLSTNWYWLSTAPDRMDTARGDWFYTPMAAHMDLTGLERLGPAEVQATVPAGGGSTTSPRGHGLAVSLHNTSACIAFFIRLQLLARDGREVLPVWWDDNYLSLLPGEQARIGAAIPVGAVAGGGLALHVSGWNVPPFEVAV